MLPFSLFHPQTSLNVASSTPKEDLKPTITTSAAPSAGDAASAANGATTNVDSVQNEKKWWLLRGDPPTTPWPPDGLIFPYLRYRNAIVYNFSILFPHAPFKPFFSRWIIIYAVEYDCIRAPSLQLLVYFLLLLFLLAFKTCCLDCPLCSPSSLSMFCIFFPFFRIYCL